MTSVDLELCYMTGTEAIAKFKARKLSPVELMKAVIARCESVNPKLNAITYDITVDSLDSLAAKISSAGISGVTAQVVTDGSGNKQLRINAASGLITLGNDTGNALGAIDFDTTATRIVSANINGPADGSDNGSVTINGHILTITDKTGAEGMQLFYSGDTAPGSSIALNYTVAVQES